MPETVVEEVEVRERERERGVLVPAACSYSQIPDPFDLSCIALGVDVHFWVLFFSSTCQVPVQPNVPVTIPPRTLNPAVLKLGAYLFADSPGAKLWAARSGKLGQTQPGSGDSKISLVQASVRELLGTGGTAADVVNIESRGGGVEVVSSDKNRVFDVYGGFWRTGLIPAKLPVVAM